MEKKISHLNDCITPLFGVAFFVYFATFVEMCAKDAMTHD